MSRENGKTKPSEEPEICRDYLWGKCSKSPCRFRHDLVYEEMLKHLKFCHRFQNLVRTLPPNTANVYDIYCGKEDCNFLHATWEEEELFKATGQLPRLLAKKHRAMSAAAVNNNMSRSVYLLPPPPPPPPPPTTQDNAMPSTSYAVPSTSFAGPSSSFAVPPPPPPARPANAYMHRPPLPPPPPHQPPPPPTDVYGMNGQHRQMYSPMSVPLERLDTSQPPPPIPGTSGIGNKRKGDYMECPTSRKTSKAAMCDDCVERDSRITTFKVDIDKMLSKEADLSIEYDTRLKAFEKGLNQFLSGFDLAEQQALRNYVEGEPTPSSSQDTSNTSMYYRGNQLVRLQRPQHITFGEDFIEFLSSMNEMRNIMTGVIPEPSQDDNRALQLQKKAQLMAFYYSIFKESKKNSANGTNAITYHQPPPQPPPQPAVPPPMYPVRYQPNHPPPMFPHPPQYAPHQQPPAPPQQHSQQHQQQHQQHPQHQQQHPQHQQQHPQHHNYNNNGMGGPSASPQPGPSSRPDGTNPYYYNYFQ